MAGQPGSVNPKTASDLELPTPGPLKATIGRAVMEGATDIHIDAWEDKAALRFRVDGLVHHKETLTYAQTKKIINQIKVSADLDIEATLTPLEGQFRYAREDDVRDIRVSIIPTAPRHQSVHLRLLSSAKDWIHAEELGFRDSDREHIDHVLQSPHGLILISGPTGSGKTTTLHALTETQDLKNQVAASIEDPAEFEMPFVRQLEVNEKRGITMSEGLRTLLRMDADMLLIGEIRDRESASIAAQAALAGRLVLATVHGRDVAGAIEAIHYLDVPYYILGGALRMVISQNLVRRLCENCRKERPLHGFEAELFDSEKVTSPDSVYDASGCATCSKYGYRGRTGVFEVAILDDELGLWLADGPRQQEIRQRFLDEGVRSLRVHALEKVAEGTTSIQEVYRFFGAGVGRKPIDDSLVDPLEGVMQTNPDVQ